MMKTGGKDSHAMDVGDDHDGDGSIYYFAYGPVVNEMVRQRRGILDNEGRRPVEPIHAISVSR